MAFRARVELPVPVEEAFAWHERPGALQRLTPPWEHTRVERTVEGLAVGGTAVLNARILGPVRQRFVAEHTVYDPPHEFVDVQRKGPFASWTHRHRFEPLEGGRSALTDEVDYELPFGALGSLVAARMVHARVARMFRYRQRQTLEDLVAHQRAAARGAAPLRVAITGASGLIGTALGAMLSTGGHEVLRLVRRPARAADEVTWDPAGGTVDLEALRTVDAVVHLAADPIQPRPLTAAKRRTLLGSRVQGTGTIARAMATLAADGRARTLVSAAGVHVHGDRGADVLTEEDGLTGKALFLTEMARAWEQAVAPARDAGVRTVVVRTGIVLDPRATILQVLGTLAKLGGAAPVGGDQWWPWVSLDDTVGMYHHALVTPDLDGPFNATAPNPVTNRAFTRTLARVVRRPMVPIAVPAALPRVVLGELADDLLLTSLRVLPAKAEKTGYVFRQPELEDALRHTLGR